MSHLTTFYTLKTAAYNQSVPILSRTRVRMLTISLSIEFAGSGISLKRIIINVTFSLFLLRCQSRSNVASIFDTLTFYREKPFARKENHFIQSIRHTGSMFQTYSQLLNSMPCLVMRKERHFATLPIVFCSTRFNQRYVAPTFVASAVRSH